MAAGPTTDTALASAPTRCFQFLIGLIGLGVIAIIILQMTGKSKGTVALPGQEGDGE